MKFNFLKPFVVCILLWTLVSCKIEPQAITYGKDQCSYCVMNIVDKTHAAQYVTQKGKQFKFDAIECLVNEIATKNEENIAILLVADFGNPGEMLNATTATYLISEAIKSPMGANLSALSTTKEAQKLQQIHGGKTYTWATLKQQLARK